MKTIAKIKLPNVFLLRKFLTKRIRAIYKPCLRSEEPPNFTGKGEGIFLFGGSWNRRKGL